MHWPFLLNVLTKFGVAPRFHSWIHTISRSAHLFFGLNGKQIGFFTCLNGVRQGDHFSPLLFCIAEEVLSRCISMLVANGDIKLISGT